MAQFSAKERFIASVLSASPGLKSFVKKSYIYFNSIIYKKDYKSSVNTEVQSDIKSIYDANLGGETFFGYYDKTPDNKDGLVIYNSTLQNTLGLPSAKAPVSINIFNLNSGSSIKVDDTYSYNWQQGARAQWIDNDRLIYNRFDGNDYICVAYSVRERKEIKRFLFPVQDSYKNVYFLAVNYRRIMSLRPDYGYRNVPALDDIELRRLDNDGIWRVDIPNNKSNLILSLAQITDFDKKQTFKNSFHKVNHVMISPDGGSFIFIHRWYEGGRRHDRLLYYDYANLKTIADENMVSHMCWVDSNTLFGYLRHGGKDGFYFIDLQTGVFTPCMELTDLGNGDGHPSCHGSWIVVDTYPDKSRMQHLYLYNLITHKVIKLLEVYQSVKYQGESRCDLHPRFSQDGLRVFFDTVFSGKRSLSYIDISKLIG